jgi:predicted aspartyl protease
MGLVHVTVSLSNLQVDKPAYEDDFLVDAGAIDCLASTDMLSGAGITIEGKDVYELANGELVEYPYGFARVSFMGADTVSKVVFGPVGCEPLLGVVALESTGIGVDPVTRTLKRMSAKPLK